MNDTDEIIPILWELYILWLKQFYTTIYCNLMIILSISCKQFSAKRLTKQTYFTKLSDLFF